MSRPKNLEIAVNELTIAVHVNTALILRNHAPVKILVPVSGGKDSQACLKAAIEAHGANSVLGLFCDTKFEHPDTYAHVDFVANLYGVQIAKVSTGSVLQESIRWGRFPGGGSRHCTDYLKINLTRLFCKFLAAAQGGFEVWYGIRMGESTDRARRYSARFDDTLYEPHEIMPKKYPKYLGKMGVRFRLPVLNWSTKDVISFLDGNEHPHYAFGIDRVGCFPCLAASDNVKRRAFEFDAFGAKQYRMVRIVAEQIGKPVFNRIEDSLGCEVCKI